MAYTELSRRALLKTGLLGSGGLAALGGVDALTRLAAAAGPDKPDLYYVFAYFSGGWDILLSLDPRDPAVFTNAEIENTLIQPGYDLIAGTDGRLIEAGGISFGPFIGELSRHVDKLAIIRGMSMDTVAHETGRRRFLTGKPPSGLQARGSSAATWLASHLSRDEPIPNLVKRFQA